MVCRDSKVNNFADSLFLLIIMRSGLLAGIRWSVCMLKSHRSLCESFSRTGAGLLLLLLLFSLSRDFYTRVSRWFFTRIWVTASLLKSLGLFSVFCSISIIPYFGWSRLVLLFTSPPVLVSIFWGLYQEHQLQLVSLSLSYSTVFFKIQVLIFLFDLFQCDSVVSRFSKVHN